MTRLRLEYMAWLIGWSWERREVLWWRAWHPRAARAIERRLEAEGPTAEGRGSSGGAQ